MADQDAANVNIKLALEQAALQQGKQGVTDMQKQFDTLKAKIQDTGKSADGALAGIAKSSGGLNSELADTIKQVDKLGISVSTLRRTGGALSQLGLGGLGSAVSQIGDIAQVGKAAQESLGLASAGITELITVAGPLALAAGGVALEFKQLTDTIEAGRKEIEKAENSLVDYYKVTATGTSESIRKQIADQRIIQNANESTLAINQKKINDLVNAQGLSPQMAKTITDEIAKAIRTPNSPLTNTDLNLPVNVLPGIHSLIEESAKLATASKDATDKIDKYTTALGDNSVKANDAAQQFLDFQKLSRGSSDAVKARVQDLKDEQGALQVQIAYLQASGDTSEATSQKLRDLTDQYNQDGDAITNLTKNILPLTQAREKEAQNAKDFAKALSDATAANEKATADLKAAAEKRDQELLQIEQDYGDKLIEIAEKSAQAAEDALRKLEQKREDINTTFGRDADKVQRAEALKDIEVQIKERRQERDDLKAHLQSLRDIRRQSNQDEQDAIANRDFAQLFKLQQRKNQELDKENEKYTEQQQSRTQALNDEKDDLARQRAFERNERLIAYNNQLADARLAYTRELQQIATAKSREVEMAAQNEQRLLALKQQSYNREVQMIQATEAAKIRIFQDVMSRIYGSGDASYSGRRTTYTGSRVNFADGGQMGAGQAGWVNEPWSSGNESFTTGGKSFRFPGPGLFIPSQSGTVNKNAGGSPVVNLTINTAATDPHEVGRIARREVMAGLESVLGQ